MRKISTILLCFLVLAVAQAAVAGDVRKEAADRFDHGLRLFNEGDNPGALLEFKRAFELSGERSILMNVGLVYAEMGRPVDAVAAPAEDNTWTEFHKAFGTKLYRPSITIRE